MLEVELLRDHKMNSLKVKENASFEFKEFIFWYCGLTRSKNGPLENSNNNK
jgi:hypothetical protein